MRAAPPVELLLPDARFERLALTALYVTAIAVAGFWLARHADAPAPWRLVLFGAGVGGVCGAYLARQILPPLASDRLRWNGVVWSTVRDGELRRLEVRLDAGGWLLLRLRPWHAAARWAVAHRSTAGSAAWHGLRLACVAHAGDPAVRPAAARS